MKITRLLITVLVAVGFGLTAHSNEVDGEGKTTDGTVTFQDAEDYDREAALRIGGFTLPNDVEASLFADASQTQNPSAICFDEHGRLYVAEIHRWRAGVQDIRREQPILLDDINNETLQDRLEMYQRDQLRRPLSFYTEFEDRIVRIEDTDDDGRADTSRVWADGFNAILDGPGIGLVAGWENDLYYTNIPHLWRLRDTDGDGEADEQESLQEGFGVRMSISGHDMHGILWGPDGRLYWSIGDRGFSFTTKEGRHYHYPYEGAVFRCEPDGSNLELYHTGLRNPQELAFDKYGNLFTCDNDADAWDESRLVYILEGADSGWHHGHQVLLFFRDQLDLRTPMYQHPGHSRIPMNPWMTEDLWAPEGENRAAYALPPVENVSWGPSGLVYNYGVTAVPERYDNHFWICNFGGAKGDLEAFSVQPEGAGFALDQHEVFMEGLGNTDVEFGPDGRMYLSCFNNNGWYKEDIGNIYALSSPETEDTPLLQETEKLLTTDFATLLESELPPLLGHEDMRVRLRSQFELARRGSAAIFHEAIDQTDNQLMRLHGVWGLGQLGRKDEKHFRKHVDLLSDGDAEVRAQAVKILGDTRSEEMGAPLSDALSDESPRVRGFAAIAVGKCGHAAAYPRLVEMLEENADEDLYLRQCIVQGLWGLNEREKMLKLVSHESSAVRLGTLLVLRKLEDPRVHYFLDDENEDVAAEAIRAINDLNLITALPHLAEKLDETTQGEAPLPEGHGDWILHTRMINANFRLGEPDHAARVLEYAALATLPQLLREQALLALLEWKEPTPVDPTTGHYRPLEASTRPDISEAIAAGIGDVFESADGRLLGLTTRLALDYGVEAPVELLTRQIRDTEMDVEARIGSLEGLASQNPEALEPLWDELLESEIARFRASAVRALREIHPERGTEQALILANSDDVDLRQAGYRILGSIGNDQAIELLSDRLASVDAEPVGSLLDLLESATETGDETLSAMVTDYEASIDAADPLAPYRPALAGGNPEKGRDLFTTHAAGQCAKCHKVDGDGGVAGPELTGIGSRQDAEYLLASLVAPSKDVVPGYGMTIMTLDSGESIGGTLKEETEDALLLEVPNPDNPAQPIEKRIPLSEIASRQPPVSAMPPMGGLMTKAELRDLVSFLVSLKEENGENGH